jgi:hypothetical protein
VQDAVLGTQNPQLAGAEGLAGVAEIIINRTEHIIVETLASGKSTEVNPMGFTIVVEEVGHNPNHSYYDYV